MTAGWLNVTRNYLPKGQYLLVVLSAVLMALMTVVFLAAFMRWFQLLGIREKVVDRAGELVLEEVEE